MKSEINLLPPPLLAARVKRLLSQRLTRLGRRGLLGLSLVSAVLAAIWAGEMAVVRVLGERLQQGARADANLESSVRSTNVWVEEFARRIKRRPAWTPLVRQLVTNLPADIQLTSLQIAADRDALQIRAVASSRSAVIAWQRQLEALPGVAQVEAPLQNFATGPATDFVFTLTRPPVP